MSFVINTDIKLDKLFTNICYYSLLLHKCPALEVLIGSIMHSISQKVLCGKNVPNDFVKLPVNI